MKIYTGTGDDGTTGTLGNKRTSKTSDLMKAIGTLDELNAHLGLLAVHSPETNLLPEIQSFLFEMGSELAAPENDDRFLAHDTKGQIQALETSIDQMEESLPPLTSFILPGGSLAAAQAHVARTVCRRAERRVIKLVGERHVRHDLLVWLNRLSDWLFVFARTANRQNGVDDVPWRKP